MRLAFGEWMWYTHLTENNLIIWTCFQSNDSNHLDLLHEQHSSDILVLLQQSNCHMSTPWVPIWSLSAIPAVFRKGVLSPCSLHDSINFCMMLILLRPAESTIRPVFRAKGALPFVITDLIGKERHDDPLCVFPLAWVLTVIGCQTRVCFEWRRSHSQPVHGWFAYTARIRTEW